MSGEENSELDERIGEEIQHLRLHRRMSQTELGSAIGVTQHQIQNYEAGRAALTVRRLVSIADALHVDPSHFLRVRKPAPLAVLTATPSGVDGIGPLSQSDLRLAAKIAQIRNDTSRRDIILSIERLVEATSRAESGSIAGTTRAPV